MYLSLVTAILANLSRSVGCGESYLVVEKDFRLVILDSDDHGHFDSLPAVFPSARPQLSRQTRYSLRQPQSRS